MADQLPLPFLHHYPATTNLLPASTTLPALPSAPVHYTIYSLSLPLLTGANYTKCIRNKLPTGREGALQTAAYRPCTGPCWTEGRGAITVGNTRSRAFKE